MGELKDVLAPALSSTNRAKSHWRGKTLKSKTPAMDAFACNEVRLLVSCLAYEIMHIVRRAMAMATGTGWSLRRLRERVLRTGAAAADLGSADDAGPLLGRSALLVRPVAKDPGAALGRPITPAAQTGTANTENALGRGDVMRSDRRIEAHETIFPHIADLE